MKVLAKKGYIVEVTSWENDGDNYNTKSKTFPTKEKAIAVLDLCKNVFICGDNGDRGIGNMVDGEYGSEDIILEYIKKNPFVVDYEKDPEIAVEIVKDINYDLLGYSEWYLSRVFESGTIYYCPEDVLVEEIN